MANPVDERTLGPVSIDLSGSVDGFFHEAVARAKEAQRVEASAEATQYVGKLLADFARPDAPQSVFDEPLVFLLNDALKTPHLHERFEKLRTLGDGVLYSLSFFGERFEAKGIDEGYVVRVGKTAYENAGAVFRPKTQDPQNGEFTLFDELAARFETFANVLTHVADTFFAKSAVGNQGVVRIYERWLKTGSDELAEALGAHGFPAKRSRPGGLQ